MKIAMFQQGLHQEWNATGFKHVLGNIAATRLEIGDIGRLAKDLGHIEQIKFNAAFMSDSRQMQRCIG